MENHHECSPLQNVTTHFSTILARNMGIEYYYMRQANHDEISARVKQLKEKFQQKKMLN